MGIISSFKHEVLAYKTLFNYEKQTLNISMDRNAFNNT